MELKLRGAVAPFFDFLPFMARQGTTAVAKCFASLAPAKVCLASGGGVDLLVRVAIWSEYNAKVYALIFIIY